MEYNRITLSALFLPVIVDKWGLSAAIQWLIFNL